MKVEFLNEDMTKARLTRGLWFWRVEALVHRIEWQDEKNDTCSSWIYTETGKQYFEMKMWPSNEVDFFARDKPEELRKAILEQRRRAALPPEVDPWKVTKRPPRAVLPPAKALR